MVMWLKPGVYIKEVDLQPAHPDPMVPLLVAHITRDDDRSPDMNAFITTDPEVFYDNIRGGKSVALQVPESMKSSQLSEIYETAVDIDEYEDYPHQAKFCVRHAPVSHTLYFFSDADLNRKGGSCVSLRNYGLNPPVAEEPVPVCDPVFFANIRRNGVQPHSAVITDRETEFYDLVKKGVSVGLRFPDEMNPVYLKGVHDTAVQITEADDYPHEAQDFFIRHSARSETRYVFTDADLGTTTKIVVPETAFKATKLLIPPTPACATLSSMQEAELILQKGCGVAIDLSGKTQQEIDTILVRMTELLMNTPIPQQKTWPGCQAADDTDIYAKPDTPTRFVPPVIKKTGVRGNNPFVAVLDDLAWTTDKVNVNTDKAGVYKADHRSTSGLLDIDGHDIRLIEMTFRDTLQACRDEGEDKGNTLLRIKAIIQPLVPTGYEVTVATFQTRSYHRSPGVFIGLKDHVPNPIWVLGMDLTRDDDPDILSFGEEIKPWW